MSDLRNEVMKALPFLSDNDLSKLLMRLHELGVEYCGDMQLLQETDLTSVLKVVQCRKLLNHFKAAAENNALWMAPQDFHNKPVQNQQAYYPMNRNVQPPGYTSPYKQENRNNPSGSLNVPNRFNGMPPTVVIPDFAVSTSYQIPTPITLQPDNEEYEILPELETLGSFQYSPNTNSRPVKPEGITTSVNSHPSFIRTGNCEPLNNDYRLSNESDHSNNTITSVTPEKAVDHQNPLPGNMFSNYIIPFQKFCPEIQNVLNNERELNQYESRDFVRVVASDMLEKNVNPGLEDMASVAHCCVSAYPKSLSQVMSGRNTKPGYESLLNKICNRFKTMKQSTSFSERFHEHSVKRSVGRPKGSVNKRKISDPMEELNSSLPVDVGHNPTNDDPSDKYRLLLHKLSPETQNCLLHGKGLNDSSKKQIIQTIFNSLLSGNGSQEEMKQIARDVAEAFPRSLEFLDVFQNLCDEAECQTVKVKLSEENYKSSSANARNCVVNLTPVSVPTKTRDSVSNNSSYQTNNNKVSQQKTQISGEHCKILMNYKIPFEKFSPSIQESLTNGNLIEGAMLEELFVTVIQDFMTVIPQFNRDELKYVAKLLGNTYKNSLTRNMKNPKAKKDNYIGYLKKFMAVAVKLTGNESLNFRLKKTKIQHHSSNSLPSISMNENPYVESAQNGLQFQAKNVDWRSIAGSVSNTFDLQRKEIERGCSLNLLKENYPFLFNEKGFLQHLRLMFGMCLKTKMEQNFRDKWNILRNYFLNQSSKTEIISKIISDKTRVDNLNNHVRDVLLLIIDHFGEPSKDLFHAQSSRYEMTTLSAKPCIIVFGDTLLSAEKFSVYVERIPLVEDAPFMTALIIYFGSFAVFNIPYPLSLVHTLEFVQRCFAEIPASYQVTQEISERVDRLLKNSELQGSHKNCSESRL